MGEHLIDAAWEGKLVDAQDLVAKGVDVNFVDDDGHTSVFYARKNKNDAVADFLHASGAVMTSRDMGEILVSAAKLGNSDQVSNLIAKRADVNYVGWDGHAALYYAIQNQRDAVAEHLRSAGAALTEEEMGEQLVKAAHDGKIEDLGRLLANGANVNYVDREGCRALIWASDRGNTTIVHELILSGADIHAEGKGGKTAAQHARAAGKIVLAAQLDEVMFPSHIAGTAQTIPQSVHLLASGIPLQPSPQPTYHTLVHHEGLLLTVIGPWLRDVGLPEAATNAAVKTMVFTIISHTYTMAIANPVVAEQFFKDFLCLAAQLKQDEMPARLCCIAKQLGVNVALAPGTLRDTPEHKIELAQDDFLAFMKQEQLNVVDEVLAECNIKFVQMTEEAHAAVADFADPKHNNIGQSWTYANAKVHPLPAVPDVLVAALCLVSTFIFTHLQTTQDHLFAVDSQSTFPRQAADGLIKWPAVKTMLRMFAKMRDDYADLARPWAALLDTVRFSLVSKTLAQHASFVQHFLPPEIDVGTGVNDADAPVKKRRVDQDEQCIDRSLTVVRAKSTLDDPDATVKQELWNLAYRPAGLTFESMVGKGGLQEVASADRWEEYGDVKWKDKGMQSGAQYERNPKNRTTVFKPRNPLFISALATAREANPTVSPYVWEPALKLIAHPTFAAQPVAMVIEVQLYLEEFLKFRKAVHCFYKITRAPNLASLAQDCRKYAKNPEIAL